MKRISKHIWLLASALLLAGAHTSCTKDYLDNPDAGLDDSFYALEEGEYGLGFALSLNSMDPISRANLNHTNGSSLNDIEDFVDTEHLYILFFNIDGVFLFAIQNPTAVPMGDTGDGNDQRWFVKIPVKEINDKLIHYIEENPFKIAVLANWTFDSDINIGGNLGEGASDRWEAFEFHEPIDSLTGELTLDNLGRLTGDNISLLAHCERDNVYESSALKGGYDHLVDRTINDNPHMGPYTEWVHNYHNNEAQAMADLRSSYSVTERKYRNPDLNIDYPNMWFIWNFGGKDNYERGIGYDSPNAQIRQAWVDLNQSAREKFSLSSMPAYWRLYPDDDMYVNGKAAWNEDQTALILEPAFSEAENDAGEPIPANAPYIHFSARADGYVRVRYEAPKGVTLKMHLDTNYSTDVQHYDRENRDNRSESSNKVQRTDEYYQAFCEVPYTAREVFIYCVSSEVEPDEGAEGEVVEGGEGDEGGEVPEELLKAVTIYEIEYIESRHLYDVDRRAIMPSKEYPIPMYGIQDFDAIGEYWQPGVLFNLSTFNNTVKEGYSYRSVSLLRSLARVEVILPKSVFPRKPSHVLLRSLNRSARITPVDFFTPTDLIWYGFDRTREVDLRRLQAYENSYNFAEQDIIKSCTGVDGEIQNIRQYGPIYIGNTSDITNRQPSDVLGKLREYRQTTAWPFGIWEQQWGWDWNRDNGVVEYFETYKPGDTRTYHGQIVPAYPHVLHTRISRSDYSRFEDISDATNWHYIIYVPEKNITDADNPGNIADRPKIIHVEIRFNGLLDNDTDNIVDNLDDNGAYRLYFTEGGRATSADFTFEGRNSWDNYERNWNIASQHWPIMRNHVYRFTVNGNPGNTENSVTFQVCGADKRDTPWIFY